MSKNVLRFTLPAAAYLILIHENQILLAKRKGGWASGSYSLIAGHIDGSETMKQAISREALEEAGIEISPSDLTVTCVMHRKDVDTEYFDVFLRADNWKGRPVIQEPDKMSDLRFFPLDKLPDNLLEHVKAAIQHIEQGVTYLDYGW